MSSLYLSHPIPYQYRMRMQNGHKWLDNNNGGTEITEASKNKAIHSRQRDQLISARHAPTPITTMKLCACTSGNKPATTPAASIRFAEGKSKKEEVEREEFSAVDPAL